MGFFSRMRRLWDLDYAMCQDNPGTHCVISAFVDARVASAYCFRHSCRFTVATSSYDRHMTCPGGA